jgi:hypothetical protein
MLYHCVEFVAAHRVLGRYSEAQLEFVGRSYARHTIIETTHSDTIKAIRAQKGSTEWLNRTSYIIISQCFAHLRPQTASTDRARGLRQDGSRDEFDAESEGAILLAAW